MIIKTYPNKNRYGKYFLAMEAPEDEIVTDEQPKPRRNVKVITVKPSNRHKDFTDIDEDQMTDIDSADENQDTETSPEQTERGQKEEPNTEDDSIQQNEDTTPKVDGDNTNTDESDDQPDTGENDNIDFTTSDDSNDVDNTEDTGEDGPDVDSDTDFTDGVESDDAVTSQQDNQDNTPNNSDKPSAPGVELDSTRKYNLFKEYMSLYNACDNYIGKLENVLKDDYEENQIIRISVNNLREIRDILSDYMTIRFQLNSYIQSLLFYQKMVVAIQLVFNLLKSINTKK